MVFFDMDFVIVVGSEWFVFHSVVAIFKNFTVFVIDGVGGGWVGFVQFLVHDLPVDRSFQLIVFENLELTVGSGSVDKIGKIDTTLVVVDGVFAFGEVEKLVEFLTEIDSTPNTGLPNDIAFAQAGEGASEFDASAFADGLSGQW